MRYGFRSHWYFKNYAVQPIRYRSSLGIGRTWLCLWPAICPRASHLTSLRHSPLVPAFVCFLESGCRQFRAGITSHYIQVEHLAQGVGVKVKQGSLSFSAIEMDGNKVINYDYCHFDLRMVHIAKTLHTFSFPGFLPACLFNLER